MSEKWASNNNKNYDMKSNSTWADWNLFRNPHNKDEKEATRKKKDINHKSAKAKIEMIYRLYCDLKITLTYIYVRECHCLMEKRCFMRMHFMVKAGEWERHTFDFYHHYFIFSSSYHPSLENEIAFLHILESYVA